MRSYLLTVPTLGSGGMERSVINIGAEIVKRGHKCVIYVICGGDIKYTIPDGVEVIFGNNNPRNKLGVLFSILKLRRYCKINHPYCIFSFTIKYSCYIMMSLLYLNQRIFVLHRSNPYSTYGKVNELLNKKLFPKAIALVVQTQLSKEIFIDRFKTNKVIVFPNPVREVAEYDESKTENYIISVGRLSKGKGFDKLIHIFREIDHTGWKLLIIGDGPEKENLELLVLQYNLVHKVEFVGFTKEVDLYLKKSKIFAFASESEGFPNALLEASCMGLPCISYNCLTGPADIISDGVNGYLVDLNDTDGFKQKLKVLMTNPEIRNQFSNAGKKLKYVYQANIIVGNFLSEVDKKIFTKDLY